MNEETKQILVNQMTIMEELEWLTDYRNFITRNGLSEDGEFVIKVDKRIESLKKKHDVNHAEGGK